MKCDSIVVLLLAFSVRLDKSGKHGRQTVGFCSYFLELRKGG